MEGGGLSILSGECYCVRPPPPQVMQVSSVETSECNYVDQLSRQFHCAGGTVMLTCKMCLTSPHYSKLVTVRVRENRFKMV